MARKTLKRHQKIYKMKGCSKKTRTKKYKKNFFGGSETLAYTGQPMHLQSNPHLAYVGGNTAIDKAYPNQGSYNPNPDIPTNQGFLKRGGSCTSCNITNMMTGGCGCSLPSFGGNKYKKQMGGSTCDPQGLIGKPWTPNPEGWPGINGSRNYLDYNTYKVDPQTAMVNVGPNPPFLNGGKKYKRSKNKKQRGGAISNFISQDLINLGRGINFSLGSAYNAINGFPAPVNPLPWKDQLPNTPNLHTIKGASI